MSKGGPTWALPRHGGLHVGMGPEWATQKNTHGLEMGIGWVPRGLESEKSKK